MQIVSVTSEQQMLREVVHDVLATDSSPECVSRDVAAPQGFSLGLWRKAADLGWLGLEVPPDLGGSGGTYLETAIVLRELGRFVTPGPYLSHSLALTGLVAAGGDSQSAAWIEPAMTGEVIGAVVIPTIGPGGRRSWPVTARSIDKRGTLRLNGAAMRLPDIGEANVIVLATMTESGPVIAAIPAAEAEWPTESRPTHDQTRRLYDIDVTGFEVPVEWQLAHGEQAEEIVGALSRRAAIGIALDSVGGGERVNAMAVDYAKQRVQFGRPIGSFQALKHMCVDAYVEVEKGRIATDAAVMAETHDGSRRSYWSAVAKFRAGEAYARAAGDSLQIHGGIGMTWEFPLHRWLKRAKLNRALFGTPAATRASIARLAAGSGAGTPE
ncbi:acyl-CoA dehydrogenase family protein [Aeromicrobium panaciterrae]|uniref:acyl-CoA dehydrogenase family protein n=1 Tax=Aeromicrobium panaciterrae TaxID=363861 RepID=UPI0031D54242